jgi:hypothetical protein
MTDQFIDVNNSNNLEGTDVSQVGKVVINAVLNQSLIMQNKQNLSSGDSDFLGGSNEKNFSIYPGELCFSFNDICAPTNSRNGEYTPQVLSTFNGFSNRLNYEGKSLEELIQFEGISLGSGATYDERSMNPSIDLALTTGGLRTIVNNGSAMIKNGAWLMWKAPTKQNYKDQSRKGSERVLAKIEVYDPEVHKITIKSIHDAIVNTPDVDPAQYNAAKEFIEHFEVLKKVGLNGLGEPGSEGYEALEHLLGAIECFNHKIKRRIFCKALCPAKPGARLDIMMGRYEF